MPNDDSPADDAVSPLDPEVGVRLEAASTLIPGDGVPDSPDSNVSGTAAVASPSQAPAPPLRIILALRPCPPKGDARPIYDVTISADRGKDADCDPYWRSFVGLDLHSALDEATEVVAAAEQQWRSDPTYPRVASQPANGGKGKATPPAKRTPAAPTAVLPSVPTTSATSPAESSVRPAAPVSAAIPVPRTVEKPAESEQKTEGGAVGVPAASGPPLPMRKPKPSAGKPGERKQLSLFG